MQIRTEMRKTAAVCKKKKFVTFAWTYFQSFHIHVNYETRVYAFMSGLFVSACTSSARDVLSRRAQHCLLTG